MKMINFSFTDNDSLFKGLCLFGKEDKESGKVRFFTRLSNGFVTIPKRGVYLILKDSTSSVVDIDSNVANVGGFVKLRLEDNGAGIDTGRLTVSIDGRDVSVVFDKGSYKLFISSDIQPDSKKEVKVVVYDRVGNRAAVTRKLYIQKQAEKITKLITYPNPSDGLVTIRYSLGFDAKKVVLKIYDSSSRLVFKDDMLPVTSGMDNEYVWNLVTKDGREVLNGVYFIKLKAIGEKTVIKMTKQAVLK